MPNVEPRNALWRLGTLVRLKAASATDSATATATFEEAADFYRRAMFAEWENWSGTHPDVSEDFPAIAKLLASKADAIQLELVAKRLTEIIDPDESKESAELIAHFAALRELLVDMERHQPAAGRRMD